MNGGRRISPADAHRALEERRTEELARALEAAQRGVDRWREAAEIEYARGRALEAALRALVAGDPLVRYGGADFGCWFCETEASRWAVRPEQVVHSATCPWVHAKRLLGGEA
jgi:hypothetical protein